MMQIDEVVRFLTTEEGYASKEAEAVASDLLVSHPAVQRAFEQWRQTGQLPDLAIEGYTAQRLVTNYHFHPVAALLTMDWLLVDPLAASSALRHGYDTVRLSEKQTPKDAVEIVLQPSELVYLLRFFNQQTAEEVERQYAQLDASAIAAAGARLAKRGLLQSSRSGDVRPLAEIAELITTCANPEALIYVTHSDALGTLDERRTYITSRLAVENVTLPTGDHRLAPVRNEDLAGRICEQLRIHDQPAAPGGRRILESTAFEQAIALVRSADLASIATALAKGGLDQETALETAQSLLELQSVGAFAWLWASGDGARQGLGTLETASGLWRLDATEDERVALTPVTADQLVREVTDQVASVLASLPSPTIN